MGFMGRGGEQGLSSRLARWIESLSQFADDDIEHGRQEKPEERHAKHSEKNSRAQRLAHLRASSARKHQRNDAEDERETRHQNRAQAKTRGFNRRVRNAFAGVFELFREFNDENGVLARETYQHDQ